MARTAKTSAPKSRPINEISRTVRDLEKLGFSPNDIASRILVSARTIYRWRDEGVTPKPAQLAALRKFALAPEEGGNDSSVQRH